MTLDQVLDLFMAGTITREHAKAWIQYNSELAVVQGKLEMIAKVEDVSAALIGSKP